MSAFFVVALSALALTATPAFATDPEPMYDPSQDATFFNLVNNPMTAADPNIGGVTYKDVKVQSGMLRAGIAGRVLPKLSTAANIGLGIASVPAALETGLQIGGTINRWFHIGYQDPGITAGPSAASADVTGFKVQPVTTASPSYSIPSATWNTGASNAGETYPAQPVSPCSGSVYPGNQTNGGGCSGVLQGVWLAFFSTAQTTPTSPGAQFVNTDRCSANTISASPPYNNPGQCNWSSAAREADYFIEWSKAKALAQTGYWHYAPVCDSSVQSTDSGNDCRYTIYASESDYQHWLTINKSGTGTDPNPVPNETTINYTQPTFTSADHDAARAALADGSNPEARRWVDCELNAASSWCTDPTKTGGASTGSSTTTLAPGSSVGVTGTVDAFTPFVLPEPSPNQTYQDYIGDLRARGWVGTIERTTLPDGSPNTGMGPNAIAAITVDPAGLALAVPNASPATWPDNAPQIANPTETIAITVNPPTAPAIATPGVPSINFGPITSLSPGCKFPYGLFCYAQEVTAWFSTTPVAPTFNFTIPALHVGGTTYGGDQHFNVDLSWLDTYMGWMRDLITVALWIGAVYYLAHKFLGFEAGGDPGEVMDHATWEPE